MAQKQRKKKRSLLKRLLLYISIPMVVWFLAFVLWFFWQDMMRPAEKPKSTATPPSSEPSRPARPSRSDEKIREEDRRKLEDIIKRGQ